MRAWQVYVGTAQQPRQNKGMQVLLLPNNVVRRFFCSDASRNTTLFVLHCRDVQLTSQQQPSLPPPPSQLLAPKEGRASETTLSPPLRGASGGGGRNGGGGGGGGGMIPALTMVRMGQSETAAGKSAGVRVLGLWRLRRDWRKTHFPLDAAAMPGTASTAESPASVAMPVVGSAAVVASASVARPTAHDHWALGPWMALRQSERRWPGEESEEAASSNPADTGQTVLSWDAATLEAHFAAWLLDICEGCTASVVGA